MPDDARSAASRPSVLFALAISPIRMGGIERFAVELGRQLAAKGWDLTLAFEGSPLPAVERFLLEPGNIKLAVLQNQARMDLASSREFLSLVRRYKPRVFLYTLGGVVRWWPLICRIAGVRRSVYYDQTSRTARAFTYRAGARVKLVMSSLSQVVCASQFVKTCSDREQIVPAAKSRVILSAVPVKDALGTAQDFRARFSIPGDRLLVMHISWLVPDKGIDVALKAAARVLATREERSPSIPDLHFVFCGDGAHREEYEALAVTLGIAGHVTFTGEVVDLPGSGAFRAADLQIQCSQWHEAFCLAVAEGMSASLPQIAADIGGLPELVEDGVNGLLFEPKDVDGLADAVLKLAGDSALRKRMGEAGRQKIVERYDLTRNVQEWVKVLLD